MRSRKLKLQLQFVIAVVFSLFGANLAYSQTAVPATTEPPVQHFVISGDAAGYGGQEAVSIVGSAFQLTKYVSVGFDRISNPMDTTRPIYNLGDVNVAYELGDLLPKKLKSGLVFDTTNWIVTFQGSAGKVTAPGGLNHIAEGLGVYVSRPIANNVQLTSGIRFIHGIGHGTVVKVPNVGINFTF